VAIRFSKDEAEET